jgi:hypothetical protein
MLKHLNDNRDPNYITILGGILHKLKKKIRFQEELECSPSCTQT